MIGVIVPIAEEEAEVVIDGVPREMIDEGRAAGPFGVEPRELVSERMPLLEHAIGASREHPWIPLVFHAEPADPDAVDVLHASLELVAPRHVIRGARRHDLDVGVACEMLGDVTGVELGTAVDRLAVALNDDRQFHCELLSSGSERVGAPASEADVGPASEIGSASDRAAS